MKLDELQRIKQWHVRHGRGNALEAQAWDLMLMLWLTGWVGWLPALMLHALWAAPLLVAAMGAPALYAAWRRQAHRAGRLRCDWLRR